jgi:hypothetical protein
MEKVGNFLAIWDILRPFGKFYGNLGNLPSGNLVYIPRFGILCQETSGSPGMLP